jgi:putative hemolysin
MSSVTNDILVVFLLIALNGVFSMSEISIVSARKARLQNMANQGDLKAKAALELAHSPNRFLSTVQVGITFVGIVSGTFGGARIGARLEQEIVKIPALAQYAPAIGMGVVVILIAYFSLILGELVPKRIGLAYPEKIARIAATPMNIISTMTSPVVTFLSFSTEMMMKFLGFDSRSGDSPVTGDEIKTLIQQGTEAGTFDRSEQVMVERVLDFGDRKIISLMTPRPEVVWLDLDDTFENNQEKLTKSPHSYFPVAKGALENVIGVVHVKDLLVRKLSGGPLDLTLVLRQPLFVPEGMDASKVFDLFKESRIHIALVVDEYGMVEGLVTLNDIFEAIVGSIPDQDINSEKQAVQREDGSWLVDGLIAVDDFKDIFEIEILPGEDRGNFHTLAGFVMSQLGRIPATADHFEWGNLRFEVVDMDANRVDKILVNKIFRDELDEEETAP